MRGDKYFLMLTLMVFNILGTITLFSKLPGFYFSIEIFVMIFFMIVVAISVYYIQEKNVWGWRLGAFYFVAAIVNMLYLFTLAPDPILIVLTIVNSAGYIIALDHLNKGRLVFNEFNLEKIDIGKMLVERVQQKKLGVLDENPEQIRKRIHAAMQMRDGYLEIPMPQEHVDESEEDRRQLAEIGERLKKNDLEEDEELNRYESIIKERNFNYYEEPEPVENRGIEEVRLKDLETHEEEQEKRKVPIPRKNTPIENETVTELDRFIASPLSTKFHVPGCRWIKGLSKEDAHHFTSIDKAVKAGYNPCSCVKKDFVNKKSLF